MKGQIQVLKTTIIGGVVFLVPVIIIAAIIGKAFEIMKTVAHPLSALVPIDTVGKIAIVNLIAILLIVLVCFLAGHAARTRRPPGSFAPSNPNFCPISRFMASSRE